MSFAGRALRRSLLACFGLAVTGALVGCEAKASSGSAQATNEPAVLRYQGSPGIVSPPELAEDLGLLGPVHLKLVSSTSSGPQSIQAVATNDTDFGGAFNGAVLKL